MGIQDTGHWHPTCSSEIYNLYKELNILDYIKIVRLVWVGRITRMEDERIPKRSL